MEATGKAKKKIRWRHYLPFYLMMLPACVYLFINNYIPMSGIILAFERYTVKGGIYGSEKVGLQNFKFLFSSNDAFLMTRNTILYNLAFIVLGTILAIFVAYILYELKGKISKKVYQTVILFPGLISIIIIAYLANAFLAGDTGFINNYIMKPLGLQEIAFYSQAKYWPFILVFINLWKSVGSSCILYLANMSATDPGLYEAAALDGAGRWASIRYITLPGLKSTIITLTILNIGRIFSSDFGLFYQVPMNSGALVDITQTIDTYVYRGLMNSGNIGMSAAAGLYQSFVGFVLVIVTNGVVNKVDKDNALF